MAERTVGTPEGDILLDRAVTMKKFRNGEMAYTETPLGGCTKVGQCDIVGIRFVNLDCLGGCPNLVGKLSKLERVIAVQTALVVKLHPDSFEWRAENADLNVLISARDRVLKAQKETERG